MQLRSIVMANQDLAQHEDLRVKPLSFHQSITASTYISAESIATLPPESYLDDVQLRALLVSPLYLQEREASVERSQVYHSERQNLMSISSQDPTSTGKLVAVFSNQNKLNQDTFPIETIFPQEINRFLGVVNFFIRFSNPANVAKSLFDGNRDHLLAEARSEVTKQEYKVESLNNCVCELQQQAHHG